MSCSGADVLAARKFAAQAEPPHRASTEHFSSTPPSSPARVRRLSYCRSHGAFADGYVLKPTAPHSHTKCQVSIELVGACNLGKPSDVKAGECLEPYVTVVFAQRARSESKRSHTIKRVKGDLSEGTAPMWRETISFDYDDEPLQFVRFKLCVQSVRARLSRQRARRPRAQSRRLVRARGDQTRLGPGWLPLPAAARRRRRTNARSCAGHQDHEVMSGCVLSSPCISAASRIGLEPGLRFRIHEAQS